MNRPDELIKELENFSSYEYGDELSIEECHIIADYIKSLEKEIKQLIDEVDYYKHEYYSECDLREVLEKALDKCCDYLGDYQMACNHDGYDGSTCPYEKQDCINCKYGVDTKEQFKEWSFKDRLEVKE